MTVTFEWIIYIVVQRNSLPRHPSSIPRTSNLDSSEHILQAEAVGTLFSSILESFEQSIWAEYPRVHRAHPARVLWVLTMENRPDYAGQRSVYDSWQAMRLWFSFLKITKSSSRPDMNHIRCWQPYIFIISSLILISFCSLKISVVTDAVVMKKSIFHGFRMDDG